MAFPASMLQWTGRLFRRMRATPDTPLEKRTWYVPALLLAPLLVLWLRDNSLFNPPGAGMAWEYFGYFRNLAEFKRSAPGSVAGSQYSWLLPGAAVHSVLPPLVAGALLHLGVQALASLSLFFTLRRISGARCAFLAAMASALNPWTWSAAGWDYPDGAAIAFFLLALAILTRTAMTGRTRLGLLAAGICFAAAVYADTGWLPLAPLPPLYYLHITRTKWTTPPRRLIPALAVWFGGGFALLTAALSVLHHWLEGQWLFFAAPVASVLQATRGAAPRSQGLWWNDGLSPWLLLPVAALLAATAARKREPNPARLFSWQLLYALLWLAVCQWRGGGVLGVHYRASVLLPLTFLLLGTTLWHDLDRIPSRAYLLYSWALATALACAWLPDAAALVSVLDFPGWLAIAAVVAAVLLRRTPERAACALAGLFLATALGAGNGEPPHSRRLQFGALAQARDRLEAARGGRPVRFWRDPAVPVAPEFAALLSTYPAEYRLERPCEPDLPLATFIATSGAPPSVDGWREHGLRLIPAAVGLLRVEAIPGAWQPVLEFPPVKWTVPPGAPTRIVASPDGVHLRTRARPGSLVARSPAFTAPVAGRYRFTLRHGPGAGAFRFGLQAPGAARDWLASSDRDIWTGSDYETTCWLDLPAGRAVEPALAILSDTRLRPASALLTGLSVVRIADPGAAPSPTIQ
jgi:hypothetical protein